MQTAGRVSDADRERMAGFLSRRSAEGYLSVETFVERIDCAYAARSRDDLEALARDLPGHPEGWMRTTWHRLTGAAADTLRAAGELVEAGASTRRLVLDGAADGRLGPGLFTIGRAEDCDFVLSDPTASRCHAELRCEDDTWILTDLRSRNGTFVNGRRAWRIVGRGGRRDRGREHAALVRAGVPGRGDAHGYARCSPLGAAAGRARRGGSEQDEGKH